MTNYRNNELVRIVDPKFMPSGIEQFALFTDYIVSEATLRLMENHFPISAHIFKLETSRGTHHIVIPQEKSKLVIINEWENEAIKRFRLILLGDIILSTKERGYYSGYVSDHDSGIMRVTAALEKFWVENPMNANG